VLIVDGTLHVRFSQISCLTYSKKKPVGAHKLMEDLFGHFARRPVDDFVHSSCSVYRPTPAINRKYASGTWPWRTSKSFIIFHGSATFGAWSGGSLGSVNVHVYCTLRSKHQLS
jgi:hypothetical protein